jgi:tetratricopeptide (TPR) repeat protein
VRARPSDAAHEPEPYSTTGAESAVDAGGDRMNLSVAPLADLLAALAAADAPALFDLGGRLAGAGRHDDAVDVLYRCTAADPRHLVAWLTLAQVLAHQARYVDAMDACLRALEIDPGSAPAMASLQQILPAVAAQGDVADARARLIAGYRMLLDGRPDDVETWLQLGAALDRQASEAEREHPVAARHDSDEGAHPATPMRPGVTLESLARQLLASAPEAQLSDMRGHVSRLADRNAALAQLIAAQHQRGGYLAALDNWVRYEHSKTYFRNLGLYGRTHALDAEIAKPASAIPASALAGFSMDGQVPIEQGWLNASYPPACADVICDLDLHGFALALVRQFPELPRGDSALARAACANADRFTGMLAQQAYGFRPTEHDQRFRRPEYGLLRRALFGRDLAGRQVATVTTLGPWIEAMCLLVGARPTRISPTPVISGTDLLPCMTVADWSAKRPAFDHVIAYGVVEHAGLGRLGEPLDPSADRALIEQLSAMLQPGGLLFLFLPVGSDTVVFNAGRVYGRTRLPYLLQGWRVVDAPDFDDGDLDGTGEQVSLLVLGRA